MVEVAERLLEQDEVSTAEDIRFSYSRPEQHWIDRGIIRLIERISGQPKLEKLYREWAQRPLPGENIFAAALRLMEIDIDTSSRPGSASPGRVLCCLSQTTPSASSMAFLWAISRHASGPTRRS